MELLCNVVHALIVAQYPLGYCLADFAHKTLHVQVLEHATDDSVRKKVRSRERKHEPRRDIRQCLVEVRRVLCMTSNRQHSSN